MKYQLKNIVKNPFRDYDINPLNADKIEKLKESIKKTNFWDNVLARPNGDLLELAYGHHRLEALRQIYDDNHTIEVIVLDLDDDEMLQIMMNENDDWYGSSANKHEAISSAKKLHPEYANRKIAEFLGIDKRLVESYANVTKAIDNNYIDKNMILEVNNYKNLGTLSNAVMKNEIAKKDISKVYKRSVTYSRKHSLTVEDVTNAYKDIENEKKYFNNKPKKTEKKEEKFIELHQLISKAKFSVQDAVTQVQNIVALKDSISDNKEIYRAIGLVAEIKQLIKISQPILKPLSDEIDKNKTNITDFGGYGTRTESSKNQFLTTNNKYKL